MCVFPSCSFKSKTCYLVSFGGGFMWNDLAKQNRSVEYGIWIANAQSSDKKFNFHGSCWNLQFKMTQSMLQQFKHLSVWSIKGGGCILSRDLKTGQSWCQKIFKQSMLGLLELYLSTLLKNGLPFQTSVTMGNIFVFMKIQNTLKVTFFNRN